MKILEIRDNGGKTFDRYTVVYEDIEPGFVGHQPDGTIAPNKILSCLGMSERPFHPQGFGQHSSCQDGKHLGKKIRFEDLPADCQKAVLQDIEA